MIIMTEIKGKVLDGPFSQDPTHINKAALSHENARKIIIELIYLIDKFHTHGIIYGDGFCTNVIITDDWHPIIIDFDNSFFKDNPPAYILSITGQYPIEYLDKFNLLEIMKYLLEIYPQGYNWELMKAIDLLKFTDP